MNMEAGCIEVEVTNEYGLHARPAAMIVRMLNQYECTVLICYNSEEANCRNILDIMSLAAACGEKLEIKAEGPGADEALVAIKDLFESRFGE